MIYKNFKTVKIKGGLGNQLFQYAFALFLKSKFDTKITLEVSWYSEQSFRKFELNNLLANNIFDLTDYTPSFFYKILNKSHLSEKLISYLLKKKTFLAIQFLQWLLARYLFCKFFER